jgi:hypothetical protein
MPIRSVPFSFVAAAILAAPLVLVLQPSEAQQPSAPPVALTIYNQDFAVARTSIDLDLHAGVNEIMATQVTSQLEPDSVILRDPAGKYPVRILEQNYDAAIVNQDWLLQKYEGKTIDFEVATPQGTHTVQGRIVRAPFNRLGETTFDGQFMNGQNAQPLIEVNGKMQFQLPGTPLFPASTDGLLLKPTLRWQIHSDKAERFSAELAYITGGLDWRATYNIVVPESNNVTGEEKADVLGWVTIHNQSGSDFPEARIKLMAGDVAKIQPQDRFRGGMGMAMGSVIVDNASPQVTQKPFDDFHLYDLNRTVSLRDGEIKQVQFLEAAAVTIQRSYLYNGSAAQLQPNYYNGNVNQQSNYGLDNGNTKVAIVEEIKNSESNHLGIPLPAGRVRLYRRDSDGQMEFTGENMIGHTPAEDTLKLVTGSAFDLKGERKQTNFHIDFNSRQIDESFEIRLTNQKQQPVTVTVLEPLYRGENWAITEKSSDYAKRDSHTIEFPVEVPSKGSATVIYTVHYTW